MTGPTRVLIVLHGAIGDVICGMPLAQRLRAGWPGTRILWAVEPAAAPLLDAHPAVDEIIVFDRGAGLRALPPFLRAIRASRPDVVLDLQRHFKSGLTSWWSGAPRRIGFHWRNSREGNRLFNTESIDPVRDLTPKLLHFLRFADRLQVPPAPVSFGLAASATERLRAEALLAEAGERVAAVVVGTSWESKYWWPRATATLCRQLRARGLRPVLLGAPGDMRFALDVLAGGAGDVVNLVGRTSLREVLAILERAVVVVGPDTGPMHIAAAVGTPVVALFGATSPNRSGPWGWHHLVVRDDVPCMPCYLLRCPIGRLCMERITPAMVLQRVDEVLAGHTGPREWAGE